MKYEWSSSKNTSNMKKHALNFEDVHLVFQGATITFMDGRKNYGKIRYITLGKLLGRVVVIAHTQREHAVRIISMRKANEKEQKIYQERH